MDIDSNPNGIPNEQIFNELQIYEVRYVNGMIETPPTNIVAENLLAHFL